MKQFVSDASHELRTPLTAIRGFADVLLRRLDSYVEELKMIQCDGQADGIMTEDIVTRLAQNTEKIAGMRLGLRTMQQETARLEELVRDLLHLAKLEENLTPQLEQVEMAALVQSLQPQFQLLAGARQIIYDLAQVVVACDRSMLQQILYNIVTNAIQHTDPEYGIVQIRLRSSKKKGALLMVSDNGPGIAKEQVERIFDRFYRASGSRDRNPGGAGLGLAIVAEIVRVHEGRIWAESEQGAGTTMFVEL
nr:ATP-binding protein [Sulfoacidibacillus ferrooxidans]